MNWQYRTLITLNDLNGMLAMIDISEENAYVAMARRGLSLAPPPAPNEVEAILW